MKEEHLTEYGSTPYVGVTRKTWLPYIVKEPMHGGGRYTVYTYVRASVRTYVVHTAYSVEGYVPENLHRFHEKADEIAEG